MSSKRMFRRAGFFCLSVGLAFAAEARKPFELDFSVNNGADTLNDVGFTTVAEAIEEIDLDRLGDRLNYNPDGSQVLVRDGEGSASSAIKTLAQYGAHTGMIARLGFPTLVF